MDLQAVEAPSAHGNGELKTLRLVNKAFCKVVTPLVFECLAFFPARSNPVDTQVIMSIVSGDIAAHVKTLIIRPILSSSVDDQWAQSARLAHALPVCFSKFTNLRTIRIDGGIFLGADGLRNGHSLLSQRRSFVKAVHEALFKASPLHLTGLELDFPVLEGFFEYFSGQKILDQFSGILARLERLSVTVKYRNVQASRGSSPSQRYSYPDLQYQDRFWTLIGLATNLRSLKIHCNNALDLDKAPISNLRRIERLDLSRVRCHTDTLVALCTPPNTIKSIRLAEVRLITGIWAHVFDSLKDVPTLMEFDARSLTYDAPSSHFARILHPLNSCLEIPRRDDCEAFQELNRVLGMRQSVRGPFAPFSSGWLPLGIALPN